MRHPPAFGSRSTRGWQHPLIISATSFEERGVVEAQDKARWTWHLISWVAPVSFGILFLVLMVALIGFEPFIFVIAIITLVAGYVGRRFPRRAGPITVAAVMTLLILGNLPALIDDLAHPDSFVGFALFGVVAVAFALAAIIASIAILIGWPDDGATRVVYTAIGVMVIGMATLP